MNLTIDRLSVRNIVDNQSPLLCKSLHLLNVARTKVSYSFAPFLLLEDQLSVHHSSFTHFREQVFIERRLSSNLFFQKANRFELKCSIFSDIITDKSGSVFDTTSSKLEITFCSFERVVSTSFPGCFKAVESNVKLSQSTFTDCRASGSDSKYGNAYSCIKCDDYHTEFSTLRCSPSQTETGDSTIYFYTPKTFEISYYNASDNKGDKGSASFSFWYTDVGKDKARYVTVANAKEYMALEIIFMQSAYISYFNFIDCHECSTLTINNNQCQSLTIENSIFINPKKPIAGVLSTVHYVDCYTNDKIICDGCQFTTNADFNFIDMKYGKNCAIKIYSVICRKSMIGSFIFVAIPIPSIIF